MIQDIIRQLWDIPRTLMLAGLLVLAFLFFADIKKRKKEEILAFIKQRWKIAFIIYFSFILTGTIFSRQITNPYQSILKGFISNDTNWNKEIVENILLFVPYSFLFLQAFTPIHPWKSSILLTVITTVFIEISQLLFWLGFFQVADIIHNIIGGIIGIALWRVTIMLREKAFLRGNEVKRKLEKNHRF